MAERCFDTQPPIDFNKIKGVFGNLEFVRNFMESLAIDKHFLENAYRLGDWVLIGDIAHRIRGCALYFGAGVRKRNAGAGLWKDHFHGLPTHVSRGHHCTWIRV